MSAIRRSLVLTAVIALTTGAFAQVSLAPPGATPPEKPAAPKPAAPAKPKARPAAKEPTPAPTPQATPSATVVPAPAPDDPNVDVVYGAFQRGLYKTTFDLATK